MRTIKVTEPTLIKGVHHDPGIYQLDPVTASSVVAGGRGFEVPDGTVENRDPGVTDRDPKPKPETAAEKKARQKAEAEAKAAADKKAAEDAAKSEADTSTTTE